jgi:hypothetical protein
MPVTVPVEEPTVAMEVLPLVHTPEGVASLSVVLVPRHTPRLPVIPETPGEELTVILVEVEQPVPVAVKVIAATPAATPVTTPEASTVAMPVAPLDHVPGPPLANKLVVLPTHTAGPPEIGPGGAFTVAVAVVIQPAADV